MGQGPWCSWCMLHFRPGMNEPTTTLPELWICLVGVKSLYNGPRAVHMIMGLESVHVNLGPLFKEGITVGASQENWAFGIWSRQGLKSLFRLYFCFFKGQEYLHVVVDITDQFLFILNYTLYKLVRENKRWVCLHI